MAEQTKKPEYITVTIQIRTDLVTHWGGIVINNFVAGKETGAIVAENVTAPGFMYQVSEEEPTFKVETINGKGVANGKPRTTRKKVSRKKKSG